MYEEYQTWFMIGYIIGITGMGLFGTLLIFLKENHVLRMFLVIGLIICLWGIFASMYREIESKCGGPVYFKPGDAKVYIK